MVVLSSERRPSISSKERVMEHIWRSVRPGRGKSAPREIPAVFAPVGVVQNAVKESQMFGWETVESRIAVRKELADALDGLDGYSHIIVLFWIHGVPEEERTATRIHPMGDPTLPLLGVFATRTQLRPNPIGVSIVPLLGRKGNVLRVKGLDAIDGTPVLDIKPYIPHYDSVPRATIPDWAGVVVERRIHSATDEPA
jgi:tRNA-Thr(GGU) m(6)t(6)A37 methyltransferase TsaA